MIALAWAFGLNLKQSSLNLKGKKMSRSTAIRVRMDLAIKTDTTDMEAFAASVAKVQALKAAAIEAGFSFTEEVSSRVGSHDFGATEE